MNCPRCGVVAFADRNLCPDCGWQLSRPHPNSTQTTTSSTPGGTLTVVSPLTTPLEAPGDFSLSPPAQRERARAHRRRKRSWWQRLNGRAVAVLPEEARWEEPARLEVIEMPVIQTAFDFTAAEREAERLFPRSAVAPLAVRFHAAVVDFALVGLTAGVFFGLFAFLGGRLTFGRRDLAICLAAAFVLAAIYFGLFTLFGGRTPGMQYFGLRVLGFDGEPPDRGALARRAAGYVVSLGSLLLGFLWAALDDRQLSWHDHISETLLTHRQKA